MDIEILKKYARLIIEVGVNLKQGEYLVVNCDVCNTQLAELVAEQGYIAGASRVFVYWRNESVTKLDYLYASKEELSAPPFWMIKQRDFIPEKHTCYVNILSEDPEFLKAFDAEKISEINRAVRKAYKKFYDQSIKNEFKWCLVGAPSVAWASRVFPQLSQKEAVEKLWDLIISSVRVDKTEPVCEWKKHIETLEKRSRFLNQQKFTALYYHNSLGTDVTVGLPEGYVFAGGADYTSTGVPFAANMPTEEVYSAPHRDHVDGKIVASMPLFHNGKKVEDFWIELKNGKIVDYGAKEGFDTLKGIIETDEGSHHLGEVALISYDSPISNTKTLFLNTLFDENASCHFAIGFAYTYSVEGGAEKNKSELKKLGVNSSQTHVDFMIGTADLSVVGIKKDGTKVDVIKNGNLVF